MSSTFDELNKFYDFGMPVASSQYWNSIHGAAPGEALKDAEGLQIMRTLAKNMSFLIKSIQLGKGGVRTAGKGVRPGRILSVRADRVYA